MAPLWGLLSSLLALQNGARSFRNSPHQKQPSVSPAITTLPVVAVQEQLQDGNGNAAPSLERMSRRQAILGSVLAFTSSSFVIIGGCPLPVSASEVRAPIECLLPATRVKLYIDELVRLCTALLVSSSTSTSTSTSTATATATGNNSNDGNGNDVSAPASTTLNKFQQLLMNPPVFIQAEEAVSADTYRTIKTQNAWNKARRSEREQRGAELGIDYTTPYDKFNTGIQEWGDQRQFQILRRRQLALDSEIPMRAALNAYTNNLVFGDGYQLNASGLEKKNMVRNDALPNVQQVVVSDLDLRDLIRNQILQNMDDARAELKYQLQPQPEQPNLDAQEVLNYLTEAQVSCDKWFRLIPDQDVQSAIRIVSSEAKDI